MQKEKVIQLGKDSGLVFNTELVKAEVYPHHRKSLYLFASMIELMTQAEIASRFDDPVVKARILAKI